jgi:hypothetical protein
MTRYSLGSRCSICRVRSATSAGQRPWGSRSEGLERGEVDGLAAELELHSGAREELADVILAAPGQRRGGELGRRGRHVGAHGAEEASDRPLGRPRADAEAAPAPQHAGQLAGDDAVARCEHASEDREDDVEALVRERKVLRVAFLPVDREAGLTRQRARDVEKPRGQVEAHGLRSGGSGSESGVACAARHIEDVLSGDDRDVTDDSLSHRPELPLSDRRIVARRPRGTGVRLELIERG